jgi:hypothetical protein
MMDVMTMGSMLDSQAGLYGCSDAHDYHHHQQLNHHHVVDDSVGTDATDVLTDGWSVLDLGDFSGSALSVSPAITPASDCDEASGSPVVRRRRTSSAVSEDFDELLREARGALAMSAAAQTPTARANSNPPPATPLYAGFSEGLFGPTQLTSFQIEEVFDGAAAEAADAAAGTAHDDGDAPMAIPDIPSTSVAVLPPVDQHLLTYPGQRFARSPTSPALSSSSTASESCPESVSPYQSCLSPTRPVSSSWARGGHASPSPSPSRSSPGSPMRKRRSNGASTDPALAGQRNHVCQLCDSRFLCRSKLDRHMLTHTGAKPFACYCGKSFNQKSALKNHTRRHVKKGNVPVGVDTSRGLNGFSMHALVQQKLIY